MSDLISRDDVIDAVTKYCKQYDLRHLLADIECLQATKESERKEGKWIIFPPCFEEICMCSNCKTKFKEAYQHRDTCPSCGARMECE